MEPTSTKGKTPITCLLLLVGEWRLCVLTRAQIDFRLKILIHNPLQADICSCQYHYIVFCFKSWARAFPSQRLDKDSSFCTKISISYHNQCTPRWNCLPSGLVDKWVGYYNTMTQMFSYYSFVIFQFLEVYARGSKTLILTYSVFWVAQSGMIFAYCWFNFFFEKDCWFNLAVFGWIWNPEHPLPSQK